MKVTIEIAAGRFPSRDIVTKADVEKNIQAIQRAIDGKPQSQDATLLIDAKYILIGIQEQLREVGA